MTYQGDDSIVMKETVVTPLPPPEESALKPVFEPNILPVLAIAGAGLLLLS